MKKQIVTISVIAVLLTFGSAVPAFANLPADPVLQIPAGQRDLYETDVFSGSTTYSYPITLPKGTNDLTPDVSLSYNSGSAHDTSSYVGMGWELSRDYIQRDVNYTPSSTGDDKFKLHFKGQTYDLVYSSSDSLFHTKIESHLKIQQILTGGQGSTGIYWQVTTTDGAVYRFGYLSNSELVCNGQSYDAYWNLDQVQDTHNNHIYYTYTSSNGVSYLSQIKYNNDQQREVDFTYASNPSQHQVYLQGCNVTEASQLSNIQIKAASSLVHEFDLGYATATNSGQLLNSITEKGTNATTTLPATTFSYKPVVKNWGPQSSMQTWLNNAPVDAQLDQSSVTISDVNGDGLPDIVKSYSGDVWKVLLNQGTNWSTQWQTWVNGGLNGAAIGATDTRLIDINGDGLPDIVKSDSAGGGNSTWDIWYNTGSGWSSQNTRWLNQAPINAWLGDDGVDLVDVNGDGLPDIVQSVCNSGNCTWTVYLNTGSTWSTQGQVWLNNAQIDAKLSYAFVKLIDMNGDGLPDIVKSAGDGLHIWKNTGSAWTPSTYSGSEIWLHNASVVPDLSSPNVVLVDVNGDGLPDYVQATDLGSADKWQVLLNKGNDLSSQWDTWVDPSYNMDVDAHASNVRISDINGDGLPDLIKTGSNGGNDTWNVWVNNGYAPDMLGSVHTSQGGNISFEYTPSTKFDNTGGDGLSDLSFALWVTQSKVQNNGMSTSQATNGVTTYSYKNGAYNWPNREFRGFGEVDETDPNGSKKQTLFKQDDGLKGTMYQQKITDGQGNPYTEIDDTWNSSQTSGIYRNTLTSEKNYTYDGTNSNPKSTEADFQYDQYGNVTKKSELGDISTTGDERFTYTQYTYNTSSWILNSPYDTYIHGSDDLTKVSETWNYYDGNANLTDAPTKGDITKEVKWLNGGTNPVTTYQYDQYGNKTQETDANNHTTTYTYGLNDTTNTYRERETNAKNQQTNYSYDLGTGNLLSKIDPNGFTTSYTYDVFGRITGEIDPYDSNGYPTTVYNYFDNATAPQGTEVSKREISGAPGTIDSYTFVDGLGRKVQTRTDAEDTTKQIVAEIYYDSSGQVSKESVPHLDIKATSYQTPVSGIGSTVTTYDPVGRILQVTNPDSTFNTSNYDHWVTTNTDENGHQKKQYFNAFNKISQIDEKNGGNTYTTTYTYNSQVNLTKIVDASNNNFTFAYDTLNRKVSEGDPDMGTWAYQYDGVGNITQVTDNRGTTKTKTYDELNRLTKTHYPTNTDETYTYDGNSKVGTLTSVTDDSGTTSYSYDNRLRKTQEQETMDGTNWTTQYNYDAADRLISQTNPDGEVVNYGFNQQGEIASVSGVLTNIDYNALNKITAKTFANGLTTSYVYNTNNFRLNGIQTGTVQDMGYTYDNVGNVKSITNNLTSKTQNFGYDDLDRLTVASESAGYNYAYQYNPIGNLTTFTNAGNDINYTYGQSAGVHALTSSSETAPTLTPTPSGNITFRSVASGNNGTGGTSLTINKPTGTISGDILLAHVVVRTAGNTITAPSGWSLVLRKDTGSSISTASYWKLAGGSEPTSYTWTFGTSGEASGGVASYIGVNTTNPIDASNGQYNVTTSTVSNTGITTTNANDMLVYLVGITVPTTVNVASGFTNEWSATSTSSTTSEMSDEQLSASGATGTITESHNGGANSNVTELIGLNPASNAAPTSTPTPTSTNTPTPTPTNTPTPTPTSSGITLRSTATGNNGTGSTSLSLSKPTGTVNGDIIISHVVVRTAGNTITAPSGWTLIQRQDSGSSISTATYWKLAGSSEPTSYSWGFGTSGEASGGIASYTGVDTITPIDAYTAQYNVTTSTVSNSGLTTSVANDKLVYAVGITVATTVNVPSGFINEWSTTSSTSTTSEMSDELDTTIGATGTVSGSHNGGSNSNITQLIALKPAAAPTATPTPTNTPTPTPTNTPTPTPTPGTSISIVNKTAGTDTDGNSSATTASITPSANKLYLLTVSARTNDGTNTGDPTVTGDGLTWVKINSIVYDQTSTSRKAVALYRALGSSPSSGSLTINYGSQNPTAIAWSLEEVTGMDTTGTNGSGAVVQSATNWSQDTSGLSSTTVTLAAFSSTRNATFGAFAADGNTPATVSSYGTGFASVGGANSGGDGVNVEPEWRSDNDTTVGITWNKVVDLGAIAVELKAQ